MGKGSSKSRVMATLSQYEKSSRSVSLSINVRAKDIDGEVKKVYSCEHYGMMEAGEGSQIPKEYTNKEEFMTYLTDLFDKVESQV